MQIAGAEQPLARMQDPQKSSLKQACGAIDPKPAGPATPKPGRGLLGLSHGAMGQEWSPQAGELRQVQGTQWPCEQCRQRRWKPPPPPVGGQMEGKGGRRLLQRIQEHCPGSGVQIRRATWQRVCRIPGVVMVAPGSSNGAE